MQWHEVFDKYFVIAGSSGQVLVFIPGSYDGNSIRYAWTTREAIECGIDVLTLERIKYTLYSSEIERPSDIFKNWHPMETLSNEERICRKIRVMEERWKKFQEGKIRNIYC